MKELIESTKDFKIIPNNFKSAGAFELLSVTDELIKAKLILADSSEIKDYKAGSIVEVFGVNNAGLVYFETKLISVNGDVAELAATEDYSIIQRREYSRVGLKQGTISFKDINNNIILNVTDISAGGAKIITNQPLDLNRQYEIEINLSNNMKINCNLKPIRVDKNDNDSYTISGKFTDLENADRIILIQYAFRIKMEEQK